MSEKEFFIGRTAAPTPENVLYDPDDFTTHGVIVGMTGSGKTGLLIDLLEEAALKGLPAIIIDPKGDLTNLLLHFPDLLPTSFEPWIDPEAARREGMSVPQLAEKTAANWQKGLAGCELGHDQLLALKNAVDYVVYTPGSNSGEPVNLLASFAPPAGLTWAEHREILRERISSTVTALLGLDRPQGHRPAALPRAHPGQQHHRNSLEQGRRAGSHRADHAGAIPALRAPGGLPGR